MMQAAEYPYLDMYARDNSKIAVEHWQESWSVGMHRHKYYELMFIHKGSCRHMFRGVETLLIPGDAVFIPSHEPHGYALHGEISLYNCQFYPERLDEKVSEAVFGTVEPPTAVVQALEGLLAERESMHADILPQYEINNSKQGVLHFAPVQHSYLLSLIQRIPENGETEALLQQKYIEVLLLEVRKATQDQDRKHRVSAAANQRAVAEVLASIETNLAEPFDIEQTAQKYAFTPNYFRKLFKDVTGLSPVQYINRLRIIRACEYIEEKGLSIRDAAELVGIYDLNYFSRLFKKIIGCTPNKL